MLDPTYPFFPIVAFLGFILSLVPLPWHLQAWNSGTCFFMVWTSLACLNQFVNSVVWAGNALNPAAWWCEISIRIIMGASVGIPASSLCIVRRLYNIASVHTVTVTHAQKRRAILIDSLICVLFPIIYIALQYVVQGHRFNIFEDIGCYPSIYNTLPAYFISMMWPVIIGLISAVYCVLALREFNRRRMQFNQFLSSSTSLTISRYFRLMALAMTEMMCTTPLAIFVIWLNATSTTIGPWRSWDDTHFAYWRIEQIPGVLWRSNHLLVVSMELTRWASPFCAIVFFIFFGFAQEARKNYRIVFDVAAKRLGFTPLATAQSSNKSAFGLHHNPKPPVMHSAGSFPVLTPSSPVKDKRTQSFTSSFADSSPSYDDIPLSPHFTISDRKLPVTPSSLSPTDSSASRPMEKTYDDTISIGNTECSSPSISHLPNIPSASRLPEFHTVSPSRRFSF